MIIIARNIVAITAIIENMQSYLVVFESKNNSAFIINIIKAFTGWGKITDSAWVITTYSSATEVRNALLKASGQGDRIFVVKSGALAAWSNVHADTEWLKRNI